MEFKIQRHAHFFELVNEFGVFRIFAENSNCPYILLFDEEEGKDYRLNLLPEQKRQLKILVGGN